MKKQHEEFTGALFADDAPEQAVKPNWFTSEFLPSILSRTEPLKSMWLTKKQTAICVQNMKKSVFRDEYGTHTEYNTTWGERTVNLQYSTLNQCGTIKFGRTAAEQEEADKIAEAERKQAEAERIETRINAIKAGNKRTIAAVINEYTKLKEQYEAMQEEIEIGLYSENDSNYQTAKKQFDDFKKTFFGYGILPEESTPEPMKGETTMKENTMNAPVQDAPEQKQPTAFEQKFFDRADRKEARAAKTSAEATAKTEAGWNMLDVIPMGQPVHGSTDRRYREKAGAKIDSGYEMMKKADYQERKAEASREYAEKVQSGEIARSDDPEAIQKLEKRIAELTEAHEQAKKAVKAHNAEFDRAVKAGELEERKLDPWGNPLTDDASDWAKRNAYTAYYKNGVRVYKQSVSSSATAEIRRLKKRIEEIRKTAEICKDSDGWEFNGGRIELNAEAGRIQAYFDEIPSDEIRTALKRDGWHWSKTAGAWQKMLNEWNIRRAKQNEILKPIEQPEPEQAQKAQLEETDDFSDIDTQAVKKRLEECGIVNGEIADPEKIVQSPFMQEIKAQFGELEQIPEESAQAEAVAEQAEPEQPKTSKGKKNKKKVMTPEEMAEELEKMKHADDWRTSAVLMLMFTNKNPEIIMCEGIAAGVITFEEFEEFVTNGYMPKYHTYAEWKKMGRQVKSGEHARFKARIWKYTEKKDTMTAEQAEALNSIILNADGKEYKEGDETFSSKFVKKESFFFGIDQTEKAGEIQRFEIGKSYETKAGIITVTGRTETELTFTAAVNGKSYTKEIQQGKKCEFVKINKAGMTAQATAEIKTTETAPETVPETKPAETVQKPEQQDQPEQTTEKFVAGLVYWDKLQIISRTDKTVTVKNILTGETFRKKINVGKPDKRKPTEAEYIKINDYSKLWATFSGCTIKESAERGIASSTKDVERAKKEEYRFHWDGFAKGRYDDAVKRLEAYKRILGEQEAA